MTDVLSQLLLQNETDNKRSFHTRIIHKPLKTISKDNDYGVSMIKREGFAMIQLDKGIIYHCPVMKLFRS